MANFDKKTSDFLYCQQTNILIFLRNVDKI